MKKPTVAVIFGSRSTEHDISVLTALASVIKPLELSKEYSVLPVYIAKDGRWFAGPEFKDIQLFQSGRLERLLAHKTPVSLLFDKGLVLVESGRLGKKLYPIDLVFPATHGTHGEDGELMAICEMAHVPYVGCDVAASVTAMDKVLAKTVAAAEGTTVSKFKAFTKASYEADPDAWLQQINKDLRYPLFIKPAHLGSSIGITRVTDAVALTNAIEVALHYDTKAIVEEAVQNLIEVTLPIMGNDQPIPALLEQPVTTSEEFFDFDTKYMRGGKGKGKSSAMGKQGAQGYSHIPADLPKQIYAAAEATGLAVYKALGCSGIARVDMLIDSKSGTVYFNEVNPLPGSLYAHNWAKAGISNTELVVRLLAFAEERFKAREAVTTSFSTNYLQQF